jgi:DNA-binding NarL/FixJ family response regulator
MNRPMYTKALRYAFMLMPYHENYYDLVHDAFLAYHKGTGLNLFDQEERTVIATVKNVWKNYISKNRYMYQGVNLQKVYTVYEDDLNSSGVDLHNQTQGDDSVVWLYNQAKKYYEVLSVVNPSNIKNYTDAFESTLDIVNLKHQGYSQKEISEKIGVSSTTIKKYMDKLKEIIKTSKSAKDL